MIGRLVFYGVLIALAFTMPPRWSGFASGVLALALFADVAQWWATRRHRKATSGRVARS